MTRNQIRKRQYDINKRLRELSAMMRPASRESLSPGVRTSEFQEQLKRAQAEAEILDKELEELEMQMANSRDEDEPQAESYIPQGLNGRAPMLVLLHGAGWTGGSQVEIWQPIAEREKLVLLAPTSISSQRDWRHPDDYKKNLEAKFYDAVSRMPVDHKRIYLIGHSIGAAQALRMGLMLPNWTAAMALHSPTRDQPVLKGGFPYSRRSIPVRIWAGSDYEADSNRYWAEMMQIHFRANPGVVNLDLDIKLLDRHGHRDYNTRDGLLDEMWTFLKDKSL
jgi:pimeloyl-ACP methyl ester carboxylesterase